MPKFTSDMEQNNIKGTSFTYSATKMDNLGASEYTLVTVVVDRSGSGYLTSTKPMMCFK